jgi:thiosulfate dehydrogenase [quinone] large subunit
MSIQDHPQQHKNTPVQRTPGATTIETTPTAVAPVAAVLRIVLGLTFAWAFLDKAFGWGYATPSERAWINGGSPTKGFLGSIDHGPFAAMFRGWAGAGWADWLFMLGLAGVGFALLLGIGLRVAAVSGTLLMLMMWAAEWPLDQFTDKGEPTMSTNPLIDYHIIYALVLVTVAVLAGNTWGLGRTWANLDIVRKNPWLR